MLDIKDIKEGSRWTGKNNEGEIEIQYTYHYGILTYFYIRKPEKVFESSLKGLLDYFEPKINSTESQGNKIMHKLMTAKEANSLASKNNQEVSVRKAMEWLDENIKDACCDGEFCVTTDVSNWNKLTNSNGFLIIPRLEELGYKVEDYYVESINNGKDVRIKKIKISWE